MHRQGTKKDGGEFGSNIIEKPHRGIEKSRQLFFDGIDSLKVDGFNKTSAANLTTKTYTWGSFQLI